MAYEQNKNTIAGEFHTPNRSRRSIAIEGFTMPEPTSEWGKELKASFEDLDRNVTAGFHKSDTATQVLDANVADIKKRVERIEDEVRLIPGIKLLGGIALTALFAVASANAVFTLQNNSALQSVQHDLGELKGELKIATDASQAAKTAAESAQKKTESLADLITASSPGSSAPDAATQQDLQQLHSSLLDLGKRIQDFETLAASMPKLDEMQQQLDTWVRNLRPNVADTDVNAGNIQFTTFQVLHEGAKLADGHWQFELRPLERVNPKDVIETSLSFSPAAMRKLGELLTVETQFDANSGRTSFVISGANEDALSEYLRSPQGLFVIATYKIR